MATNNGAWKDYSDVSPTRIFFRSEGRKTKTITIKSGQVLKARSFIETDTNGKGIAHGPITEGASCKFTAALTAGQTMILAGLTWTAGGSGTTVAQLVTAWKDIAVGTGYAALSARTGGGSFTAGTMTGFTSESFESDTVMFNSSAPLTNPTDLAATGTGSAAATIVVVSGSTTFNKIAGVTVYDVDASSADVEAAVYTEASFWADALVWAVDPAVDTITKEDGVTTVACTTYNTGAFGTSAASNLLKQKFVEGSEFEPLGFLKAGEVY